MNFTRRKFIKTTSASALAIGVTPMGFFKNFKVEKLPSASLFSKYLGFIEYEALGTVAAQIGFDKIDLAVRKGGHIFPENVKSDLVLAVKSLKKSGIKIPMLVTDIVNADDTHTETILNSAAEQGIKYYRMGYYKYVNKLSIFENLESAKRNLEKLVKLNEKYDIKGCYQNHSGPNGFIGGPLWDLHHVLKDFSPEHIGIQFDIMHASVENGYSWPTSLKLLAPWINSLALMDFSWLGQGIQKSEGVPLGQGTVDFEKCISEMRQIQFSGPITLKCEHLTTETQQHPLTNIAKKGIYSKLQNDLNYYKNYISQLK